nr:MAG TPA: hypothetical protein [Caudoviricetes sp.]
MSQGALSSVRHTDNPHKRQSGRWKWRLSR